MARRGRSESLCPKGPIDAMPFTLAGVERRKGPLFLPPG